MAAIEQSVWGGGWIRSLHRYSADLAIVAALFHLVKKLAQGHTWGPRAGAWTSGLLLLAAVLACGWTGLVMMWDVQAQLIAVEGARLLDLLPIFSEPITRTFSGAEPVTSSFFFMNLFLHVAIPLGLAGLLWFHTSRVARPTLLPPKGLLWGTLAVLGLVALVLPVPLLPRADLLRIPGEVPVDIFYAFWLPVARRLPAGGHLALWIVGAGILLTAPRWWRPRSATVRTSEVDTARCTGCTQCYMDCPYDAIRMVSREVPSGLSDFVARVDPDLCTGCGICIGSCAPMGIGPGKTGREELREVEALIEDRAPGPREVVLLACGNGLGADSALGTMEGVIPCPTGCSGSIHTSALELLLRKGAGGILVLTCPERDCLFREGPKWLRERVWEDREAELRDRVDKRRVTVESFSAREVHRARASLRELLARVRALDEQAAEDEVEIDLECEVPEEVPEDALAG